MGKETLIVENIGIRFNLGINAKGYGFQDMMKKFFKAGLKKENEFWALRNIDFSLERGDRLGILGLNGAGKSTLLKIIAGVFKPTEGKVIHKGKIVPLLELGAGFEKQYTGRENIFLYGTMLGYSKKYLEEKYDEIVKFSGLKKFIDVPIQNYSSGMRSKLGFAIATIANPEILILDEVLSVGDGRFRRKSEKKIHKMMEGGTTVLFVSHSLEQVQRICNKAMILEQGQIAAFGGIEEVSQIYAQMLEESSEKE